MTFSWTRGVKGLIFLSTFLKLARFVKLRRFKILFLAVTQFVAAALLCIFSFKKEETGDIHEL